MRDMALLMESAQLSLVSSARATDQDTLEQVRFQLGVKENQGLRN